MMLYAVLSLSVMSICALIMFLWRVRDFTFKRSFLVASIMLVFTAVFDSIIIAVGLVDYDYSKTLGILIGKAPIEDFAYTIVAALFIPFIWERLGKNGKH